LDLAKFYLSRKSASDKKRARVLLQKVLTSRHVTEEAVETATKLLKTEQAPATRDRRIEGQSAGSRKRFL